MKTNPETNKEKDTIQRIISDFDHNSDPTTPQNQLGESKEDSSPNEASEVVGVQTETAGDIFFYEKNNLDLKKKDPVIINVDGQTALGYIICTPFKTKPETIFPEGKVQKIIRIATDNDFKEMERAKAKEPHAYEFCLERIKSLKLDMKLVKVKYLFGCKKAIFFFTSNGRVDFRQLVKDLVAKYKIRIELRQIGVRDETKLVGGMGICGKELCCCSHSRKFPTVSIKMGKEQNLSLNPTKISGMCGRLLCCLSYEHKVYKALGKGIPKVGKKCLVNGKIARILNVNILKRISQVVDEDGGVMTVSVDKIEPLSPNGKTVVPQKTKDTLENRISNEWRAEFADLDLMPFID